MIGTYGSYRTHNSATSPEVIQYTWFSHFSCCTVHMKEPLQLKSYRTHNSATSPEVIQYTWLSHFSCYTAHMIEPLQLKSYRTHNFFSYNHLLFSLETTPRNFSLESGRSLTHIITWSRPKYIFIYRYNKIVNEMGAWDLCSSVFPNNRNKPVEN
jgi:hypothetical protein